jgi:hypothetical protein
VATALLATTPSISSPYALANVAGCEAVAGLHSTGHDPADLDSLVFVLRSARRAFQAARIQYDRNVQKHEEQQVRDEAGAFALPQQLLGAADAAVKPPAVQTSCLSAFAVRTISLLFFLY